jgi:hypothetical protein
MLISISPLFVAGTFKNRIHNVTVRYQCPKFGWFPAFWGAGMFGRTANLTMTVALTEPMYRPVTFAWGKQCKGWLQTSGGGAAAFFIIASIAGSIALCVWLAVREK